MNKKLLYYLPLILLTYPSRADHTRSNFISTHSLLNFTYFSKAFIPDAMDDTATVIENSEANIIEVLNNDNFGSAGPNPGSAIQVTGISNSGGVVLIDQNGTPNDPLDDKVIYYPPPNFTGIDVFVYTIVDADGNTDSSLVRVLVRPGRDDQPMAVDDLVALNEDTSILIDVLINDSFGGDGPSDTPISVVSNPINGTATVNQNGTPSDPTDDTITYVPNSDFFGGDEFSYQICDADGDCDTAIVTITIENQDDQPMAVDDLVALNEDTSILINVLINDSFGGDDPSDTPISVVSNPINGTATVNQNGTPSDPTDDTITYVPNSDFFGGDEFSYQICDADGDCDTAIVTITIENQDDQPMAVDDLVALNEDTSILIDVLINDSFGGDGPSDTPISVVSNPINGTATVNQNGTPSDPTDDTITYVPNSDFFGSDEFSYQICDADGDCDTAIVTITIENQDDQPMAVDDLVALNGDVSILIDVLINDSFGSDGPSDTPISVISNPINGTATVNQNSTPGDPTDDTIEYVPNFDFFGNDQFSYQICDADGDCDTAIVTITIENHDDQPIAVDDLVALNGDTSILIDVLINDSFGSDGPSDTPISVISNPINGTATVNQNGTPGDPTDDTIEYVPNFDFFGNDQFSYQICDADGDCDTAIVVLNLEVGEPNSLKGNLNITKRGVYKDTNEDCIISSGDIIEYEFTIENNGELDISNITIEDPLPGLEINGDPIDLEVGEIDQSNFTATYVLMESDVIAKQVINQATAIGEDSNGFLITDLSDDPSNTENVDLDEDGDPEDPTIVILKDPEGIIVYESFSPNNDGANDEFVIKRLSKYPQNNLQIFNRWGVKVFDKDQYEQNGVARFKGYSDGRVTIERGELLPVGTYYYVLNYVNETGNSKTRSGHVYLLR
ncbi:Ig-like domain-containing protein [Aquimarina sp. RZ0]|uniref:Ig-like domain-containing protein n=1 Tax=Aquimarina sp. RZ0 TaxID=2607730 RepID=UPI0011F14D67|nr:Ig-like domain-containing protein [Aquimarina sp. RZ0]KAA1242812.1 tandem-95 repeat protein [Aquimarina sp. RZ0]